MIEMNSIEDIKLVKELAQTFSSDLDLDEMVELFNKSESIEELKKTNELILEKMDMFSETQKGVLKILDQILNYLEKNMKYESKEVEVAPAEPKIVKPRRPRGDNIPFEPYTKQRKEYQTVELDGINILHVFIANEKNGTQRHLLPVNLFELLIIAESFIKGNRSILNKEVKKLCELFGLTKPQFSKVYYNLMVGKFDSILGKVDKMINDSVFTIKKSHVYRNNHDTNIDKKEFNELLSIYANSNQNFLTIYKLIKEKRDIDPFDLMIVLKKSNHVSKVI